MLGITTSLEFIPKLSCSPGIANPIAIDDSPLSIILPFEISIFLLCSLSMAVPATTTNGVYILTYFPFTNLVCISKFSYSIVILTFPSFPTIS